MQTIENFKIDQIPVWKILCVVTSSPAYEMDRAMVVENYPEYMDYTVVTGGHCSCYDFDATSWTAIVYTHAEMKELMVGWLRDGWYPEHKVVEIWLETEGKKDW